MNDECEGKRFIRKCESCPDSRYRPRIAKADALPTDRVICGVQRAHGEEKPTSWIRYTQEHGRSADKVERGSIADVLVRADLVWLDTRSGRWTRVTAPCT